MGHVLHTLFTCTAQVCYDHQIYISLLNLGRADCHTNYHHNYCVERDAKVRVYYEGIPTYIQVGEHQFVERKVVEMWTAMMLAGWCVC